MAYKSTINRTVEIMLICYGVWPNAPCVLFYRIFWLVTLIITEILHYQYFVINIRYRNLFDLMDCLSSFLALIKITAILIIFWLKQQQFIEILTMMSEDWKDCDNNNVAWRETTRKAKLSSRISNGIIILHTISACAYITSILLTNNQTVQQPFMMKMEYPFVIDTQRKYRLVLFSQFVSVVMCTLGAGLFNVLFLVLTLHIGGQMNILLYSLKKIGYKDAEKTNESFITIMTKLICKHQKIIDFSEKIEDLYSYIALTKFISNTLMICSLGFIIVTSIGSPNATEKIVRSLLFYTITNLEAFIFCFAGEYLTNKSKAVGNAAYNSGWYNMEAKKGHLLLLIILRSQSQLQLTAGKIAILSLECFTNIMKASGSYLSVLLAMK